MFNKLDLPRVTAFIILMVGIACVVAIMQGHLSDSQTYSCQYIAIACFGFATGGKFLNMAGDGIKERLEK